MTSNLLHQSFSNVEKFWEQLNRIINEYQRIVENKRTQYEYLKEQDNIHRMCILRYPKVCLQLQSIIESLKGNIHILSQKRNEKIAKLQITDIKIKEKYKNIKYELTITQMINSVQLKKLAIKSNEVLKVRKHMFFIITIFLYFYGIIMLFIFSIYKDLWKKVAQFLK